MRYFTVSATRFLLYDSLRALYWLMVRSPKQLQAME